MAKYVLKRLLLMLFTLFVIMTLCFVLIKLLEPSEIVDPTQAELEAAIREALGYDKPLLVQYGIYWKNILTKFDFGVSFQIDYLASVTSVIGDRLLPTVLINLYSLVFSVPLGIALGIFAALKKNKWQDHTVSTLVMLFVSVPSFVYAFLLQYFLGYKLGWFPIQMASLTTAGSYFSPQMFHSMILPVLALSFGSIATLARYTRAELTETLISDYMLLARAKGLTKGQATLRHALKNAMVPVLPSIIAMFVNILGGSLIIESIFSVPGVGKLYITSINLLDYNVFMMVTVFYTFIGLTANIIVDLSYGFLDPRIRMGAKKA